jgi:hypothetical protein
MSDEPTSDAVPPIEFVLWHRATRRGQWEPVAIGDTHAACLDQIGTGKRRGGDWLVQPKGTDPNRKPQTVG